MCGIAGSYNTPHAPSITRLGLYQLQHRGQEFVGMVSSDGRLFSPARAPFRAEGLVMNALPDEKMRPMSGHMSFGHVRYSTQGASELNNAQPHHVECKDGTIFFASNGDIVNCAALRRMLKHNGFTFSSENDGEVIVKLLAHRYNQNGGWIKAIRQVKKELNGSFSGVLMTRDRMFLIRDHLEMRPFCYTVAPDGAVFFASESTALDIMTADYEGFAGKDYELKDVPGDAIIQLAEGRLTVHRDPPEEQRRAHCIFEMIYFSRPDSTIFGMSVKAFRRLLAQKLVDEATPTGDIVSSVPDSSTEAALAMAQITGIPFDHVLYRHHYTGRTFIAPSQPKRDYGVKLKFNPHRKAIRGKMIILLDDSIVRGTTMRKIIGMIKRYEPKQITLLITCPLIMHPCYYGVDMKKNLIAHELDGSVNAIKEYLGLDEIDRLHFLSLEGLKACVPDASRWCFACLSGEYPTSVKEFVSLSA